MLNLTLCMATGAPLAAEEIKPVLEMAQSEDGSWQYINICQVHLESENVMLCRESFCATLVQLHTNIHFCQVKVAVKYLRTNGNYQFLYKSSIKEPYLF